MIFSEPVPARSQTSGFFDPARDASAKRKINECDDASFDCAEEDEEDVFGMPGGDSVASFNYPVQSLPPGVQYRLAVNSSGFRGMSGTSRTKALFVAFWLSQQFEASDTMSLARSEIYQQYEENCRLYAVEPVNAATFGKIIRTVFPSIRTRRLGTRGNSKYHYYGIKYRDGILLAIDSVGVDVKLSSQHFGALTAAALKGSQSEYPDPVCGSQGGGLISPSISNDKFDTDVPMNPLYSHAVMDDLYDRNYGLNAGQESEDMLSKNPCRKKRKHKLRPEEHEFSEELLFPYIRAAHAIKADLFEETKKIENIVLDSLSFHDKQYQIDKLLAYYDSRVASFFSKLSSSLDGILQPQGLEKYCHHIRSILISVLNFDFKSVASLLSASQDWRVFQETSYNEEFYSFMLAVNDLSYFCIKKSVLYSGRTTCLDSVEVKLLDENRVASFLSVLEELWKHLSASLMQLSTDNAAMQMNGHSKFMELYFKNLWNRIMQVVQKKASLCSSALLLAGSLAKKIDASAITASPNRSIYTPFPEHQDYYHSLKDGWKTMEWMSVSEGASSYLLLMGNPWETSFRKATSSSSSFQSPNGEASGPSNSTLNFSGTTTFGFTCIPSHPSSLMTMTPTLTKKEEKNLRKKQIAFVQDKIKLAFESYVFTFPLTSSGLASGSSDNLRYYPFLFKVLDWVDIIIAKFILKRFSLPISRLSNFAVLEGQTKKFLSHWSSFSNLVQSVLYSHLVSRHSHKDEGYPGNHAEFASGTFEAVTFEILHKLRYSIEEYVLWRIDDQMEDLRRPWINHLIFLYANPVLLAQYQYYSYVQQHQYLPSGQAECFPRMMQQGSSDQGGGSTSSFLTATECTTLQPQGPLNGYSRTMEEEGLCYQQNVPTSSTAIFDGLSTETGINPLAVNDPLMWTSMNLTTTPTQDSYAFFGNYTTTRPSNSLGGGGGGDDFPSSQNPYFLKKLRSDSSLATILNSTS